VAELGCRRHCSAATASRGSAANTVRFEVRIGPVGLFVVPQAGRITGELELAFVGLTAKGPVRLAKPDILALRLTADEWKNAGNGIAAAKELPAPQSVSQVRIVVVDRWAARVGSLTVPK